MAVAECGVSGSAAAAADVALARAACDTARVRFAELFGDAAPGALVVLHDHPGFYPGGGAAGHGGYGTPLPDWFEEGIAI
jgi:hypothetical protein